MEREEYEECEVLPEKQFWASSWKVIDAFFPDLKGQIISEIKDFNSINQIKNV